MITLGGTEITKAYLGGTEISKMYLGANLVFGDGGDEPTPVLPYDAKVEYLQSSGTQYIDTGVILNQDSSFELQFQFLSYNNTALIGARQSYKSNDFSWHILSNTRMRRNYGTAEKTSSGTFVIGTTYLYKAVGNKTYTQDDSLVETFTVQSFQCPVSAFVFSINNNGSPMNLASMRVLHCKISGANKTVDLMPVRKDGVGYLYDKINGILLGNSGSGSFTYGNDVTT